jgi:hypothetical protein
MSTKKESTAKPKEKETAGLTSFMDQSEIGGFVVREWTTQQFCQLYPSLKTIIDKMQDDGVTVDTFDQEGIMEHLPALTDAIVPIMPQLIKISCPEKTEEEFNAMKWPVAIALTMSILKKNMEHLTDFFANAPS